VQQQQQRRQRRQRRRAIKGIWWRCRGHGGAAQRLLGQALELSNEANWLSYQLDLAKFKDKEAWITIIRHLKTWATRKKL
jgi:hypothetical protein